MNDLCSYLLGLALLLPLLYTLGLLVSLLRASAATYKQRREVSVRESDALVAVLAESS